MTYPNFLEDPKTGLINEGEEKRTQCERCIRYGCISQPEQEQLPEDNIDLDDHLIVEPCTFCAMANGGWWGWTEGHRGEDEHRIETNGNLPGNNGITDALWKHSCNPIHEFIVTDEQVILGFVQYALYYHLKWINVLGPTSEFDMTEFLDGDQRQFDSQDSEPESWYWWRYIPKNLQLPQRLQRKLQQMIVEYKMETTEHCVPKTMQLKEGPLTDDIWTDFFNTYIEPSQVAWIYCMTMEKILSVNCGDGWNVYEEYGGSIGDIYISDFTLYTVNNSVGASEILERRGLDSNSIQDILNTFIGSPHGQDIKYFLYSEEEGISVQEPNSDCQVKFLKIMDRDIFGTYLSDIITLTHSQEPYTPQQRRTWNLESHSLDVLINNVYKILGFEETSYWEDIKRFTPGLNIYSDYTNELSFRRYLEEQGIFNVMYEYEPDEIIEETVTSEQVVEKLKEMEMIVDERVKCNVSEGLYLELMDKMCEIYKMVKSS